VKREPCITPANIMSHTDKNTRRRLNLHLYTQYVSLRNYIGTDRVSVFCARDKICTVQGLSKQVTNACMTLLQMVGYSTIPVKIGK
jgi:hypothetical protein